MGKEMSTYYLIAKGFLCDFMQVKRDSELITLRQATKLDFLIYGSCLS